MDITDAERKGIAKDNMVVGIRDLDGNEIPLEDAGALYQVLDGDRAADENGFPYLVGKGWTNSIFKTLDDARNYAAEWLNMPSENVKSVQPDTPFDYSGYGDKLEIRTIPVVGPKEHGALK